MSTCNQIVYVTIIIQVTKNVQVTLKPWLYLQISLFTSTILKKWSLQFYCYISRCLLTTLWEF